MLFICSFVDINVAEGYKNSQSTFVFAAKPERMDIDTNMEKSCDDNLEA